MNKTISFSDFTDEFHNMNRQNQFSYDGLKVLYDYLEEVYPDFDLDVIALCCEFTESTIEEALKDYDLETLEELENNTLVLKINDNTIIYQDY